LWADAAHPHPPAAQAPSPGRGRPIPPPPKQCLHVPLPCAQALLSCSAATHQQCLHSRSWFPPPGRRWSRASRDRWRAALRNDHKINNIHACPEGGVADSKGLHARQSRGRAGAPRKGPSTPRSLSWTRRRALLRTAKFMSIGGAERFAAILQVRRRAGIHETEEPGRLSPTQGWNALRGWFVQPTRSYPVVLCCRSQASGFRSHRKKGLTSLKANATIPY
jgi:hypothetical protein